MRYAKLDLDALPDLPGSTETARLKIDSPTERVWLIAVDRMGRIYYQVRHEEPGDGSWVTTRLYNA